MLEIEANVLNIEPKIEFALIWTSGQSSWLRIQMLQFRFPKPPDFLRSSLGRIIEELFERKLAAPV
jgi:hypothetical protein